VSLSSRHPPLVHDYGVVASAAPISSHILIDPAGNDGDVFGSSVASAGDLNGDGYDDLVIGAHFYPSESGQGQAYLYFGGPAIDPVADLVIPSPAGPAIGWFGISVASAGDFNGDGAPDVIVGARNSGLQGKAFIYYGGPSLDSTPDLTLIGETTGSSTWFGTTVASSGDVNEDGFDDVMVGSPHYGNSTSQVGRTYVFFGGNPPDAIPDRVFTGATVGDQLGTVVGSAGDLNGDGHPDMFATAPYSDLGGTDAGAVFIWFGGPAFDTLADLTIRGAGNNARLTYAANAGDLNADGFSDLIASERDHAEVFLGGAVPNAIPDLIFPGSFTSVAGAGDVDGDGADDFMVGAPSDDTGGLDAGRVSVFYGGGGLDTLEDLHFVGDRPGRLLGRCVAPAGRVDGPGPADLIIAAAEDPEQIGYDSGRVYVIANSFEPTGVPEMFGDTGLGFVGVQPNPARDDVNFAFTLDHAVAVRISVFDVAGHEVARPIPNEWLRGRVTRTWRPGSLPSGTYYVRAKLGDREQVRKLSWLGRRQ
jgi:hypothetical protein